MTLSTDSKNIKKIVQFILQSNGIDNLKAEIDIISAWQRYVTEREDGLTPAEVRLRIAAEFEETGQSAKGQERNQVRQEFVDTTHLEFGDSTDWNTLLDFLVNAKANGETIQKFSEWCKADPYNSPKAHQITQKPLLVKQVWRYAFMSGKVSQSEKFKDGSGYV